MLKTSVQFFAEAPAQTRLFFKLTNLIESSPLYAKNQLHTADNLFINLKKQRAADQAKSVVTAAQIVMIDDDVVHGRTYLLRVINQCYRDDASEKFAYYRQAHVKIVIRNSGECHLKKRRGDFFSLQPYPADSHARLAEYELTQLLKNPARLAPAIVDLNIASTTNPRHPTDSVPQMQS